jgi:hypothetical protein
VCVCVCVCVRVCVRAKKGRGEGISLSDLKVCGALTSFSFTCFALISFGVACHLPVIFVLHAQKGIGTHQVEEKANIHTYIELSVMHLNSQA